MTLVRLNRKPIERNLNSIVDDFFTGMPALFSNGNRFLTGANIAPVNITESDKGYTITLIAPGFEKNDFKVNVDRDLLTISAEKKMEAKNEKKNAAAEKMIRNEYTFQSFKRTFTIDEQIDATAIGASYVNGVLSLNLPKKEEVKTPAQQISIQ